MTVQCRALPPAVRKADCFAPPRQSLGGAVQSSPGIRKAEQNETVKSRANGLLINIFQLIFQK
jgi:hypothetical protein